VAGLSKEPPTTTTNRDNSKSDRGRSKSKVRDKLCRYCKKNNHNIDDCWKLQNKEKRSGTYQPKNKADGDGKVSVVSSNGDALAIFAACVSRDNKWILDTAALFHICCNKDWFSDTHVDQCQVGTNHGEKFDLT
jgi:hypothetical protein